ncbi:MAG: DUF1566 domain-containing protein [Deltaproteobacteria bacterium]|nr:DUF1566 domain-containing protein [Deltaproteobacteria bacterium]
MRKGQKSMLALAIITAFIATALFLPGLVSAGDLEPAAPPGSTMKTLDQIMPTWSQKLDASERFELVLNGKAVLDKETGLVWEQSPDTTDRDWVFACIHCYRLTVERRKGWRLPTVEELASLVDPQNEEPALPTGHPFANVKHSHYWSSTTTPEYSDCHYAWTVSFHHDGIGYHQKNMDAYVWCVRGGPGHDGQPSTLY